MVSSSPTPSPRPTPTSSWLNRVVFLGTGTSGQVPAIHCLSHATIPCDACADAILPGSRNRRGCCSVAVVGGGSKRREQAGRGGAGTVGRRGREGGMGSSSSNAFSEPTAVQAKTTSPSGDIYDSESLILIDCGPTFYSSAVAYFRENNLPRKIAGVLLTHGHSDAMLGLDNLRAWTMAGLQDKVDIYLTEETYEVVGKAFPYLVDTRKATGGGGVGLLRWNIISPSEPFSIPSTSPSDPPISITPLPVHHGFSSRGGPPFPTLGFRIDSFSYVSDCHYIPPETMELMKGSTVVVVDALMPRRHPSHFSVAQGVATCLDLCSPTTSPTLGIMTDLTHRVEHHALQSDLEEFVMGIRAHLARSSSVSSLADEGKKKAWHQALWDAEASEVGDGGKIQLLDSIKRTLDVGSTNTHNHHPNGASNGCPGPALAIPDLVVAWDGMVVDFERRT